MKLERVRQELELSGWFPGRNIDPSKYINYVTGLNDKYILCENVAKFLSEYGGLKNERLEIGIISKSKTITSLLSSNLTREDWKEVFKGNVFPISIRDTYEGYAASSSWSIILMNNLNEFFYIAEDTWLKLGNNTDNFLNNYLANLRENWIEIE